MCRLILLLFWCTVAAPLADAVIDAHQQQEMQQQVRAMYDTTYCIPLVGCSWRHLFGQPITTIATICRFAHAWDSYLAHAFPGDELKPLSQTATNSLGELGNLDLQHLTDEYRGVALTAIDALSTLAIMGNWTEFERMIYWLADNV